MFDETLPRVRGHLGKIAMLRIDADWYASVRCCLDNLYDLVAKGGIVIFDDYYTYEGCSLAVHEFLGERKVPYPLESGPQAAALDGSRHGAVLRKHRETWSEAWSWSRRSREAAEHLARLVPVGAQVILIDDGRAPLELPDGHRRWLPFPEQDGEWAGPPEDGEAAIRELERLRARGASFAAVLWPAFWWLDHYTGFRDHLRSRYRELCASELMITFDLS